MPIPICSGAKAMGPLSLPRRLPPNRSARRARGRCCLALSWPLSTISCGGRTSRREMRGALQHWNYRPVNDQPAIPAPAGSTAAGPPALGCGRLVELDDLALEVGDRLKALVDGGEAKVRDRIEDPQPLEDREAEPLARDLVPLGADLLLDLPGERLDRGLVDLAAGDSPVDARGELRPLEGLLVTRSLHDDERQLDDPLLGREATAAGQAFAPAAHCHAVVGGARVDDLVVVGLTERAAHRITVPAGARRPQRPADRLARDQRGAMQRLRDGVDDRARIVVGREACGDRPEGVAG